MTIPKERKLAVINTKQFLWDLIDPKRTPNVPLWIRKQARWLAKHYPHEYEMENPAKAFEDKEPKKSYLGVDE